MPMDERGLRRVRAFDELTPGVRVFIRCSPCESRHAGIIFRFEEAPFEDENGAWGPVERFAVMEPTPHCAPRGFGLGITWRAVAQGNVWRWVDYDHGSPWERVNRLDLANDNLEAAARAAARRVRAGAPFSQVVRDFAAFLRSVDLRGPRGAP